MSKKLRQHFEKITSLTDPEFDYIFSHFKTKKLKKHQFLVQEGDLVKNTHYVVSGLLRSYFINQDGKEHILQFAMEDWWITDFQAYFTQTKASVYVDCIINAEILYISYEDGEKICSEFHQIAQFFRKKSNTGYIALQRRILSLLNDNAKERYDQFLLQYPGLFQKLPKKLIAAYLGISRETISRLSS